MFRFINKIIRNLRDTVDVTRQIEIHHFDLKKSSKINIRCKLNLIKHRSKMGFLIKISMNR